MKAEERFVEVAGRRIWTRMTGEGRTVLLCPGAGRAGVGCAPQVEAGVAAFARVVTYDRAGLGRSDAPAEAPTIAGMARDMAGVIDALGTPFPMLLIGHSLATLPVQLLACQRPAEILGLLLLDPTPDEMVAAIAGWPEALQETTRRNLGAGPDVTPAMALEMARMIEGAVMVRDIILAHGLPDVPLIVAAMDRPDGATLRDHHEAMALRVPRGRFVAVPGHAVAGHGSLLSDHADQVVDMVRQMLRGGG